MNSNLKVLTECNFKQKWVHFCVISIRWAEYHIKTSEFLPKLLMKKYHKNANICGISRPHI